ncbi:MAG TPA: glycosyltransferase [Thermoanaerobaculia bacterium]|nr:glycosyltransferase [Thermoanaerobaculia bacterium]
MRLGIVASEMEGEPTGVGRFVEGVVTGLAESAFDGEVHLFFQGEPFEHPLWSDPRFRLHYSRRGGRSPVLWEQVSLPPRLARAGLDVLCGPAYSLPPRLPCPALVAIHDLSFELLPEELRARERFRRRFLARSAARRARRVLTISRHVAREIEELYGVAPDRIDVLPLAVDAAAFSAARSGGLPPMSTGAMDGAVASPRPIAPPYAVYLGSILPRRRIDLLLEAFAALARDHRELRLVLAGANRLPRPEALGEQVDRLGLRQRVIELGWISEPERIELLCGAELSFYLSTYEGYGLPPLESLAAGTVAVVSAGLGLDDLWPDYPFRCERLEAGEIERVARRVLDSAVLRHEVAARGRELVATLTWEACARRLLEAARRALDDGATRGRRESP